MKVFLSHSWKNKTAAQKIADELQAAGMDLWLDANNLLPGQLIQETIDEVLEKIDAVVLVWTKEASESGGVAAELFTCTRLKKVIIPCLIDGTMLDVHPYLQKIKGISFKDFDSGLGRLKMVLLNYMAVSFNMQDAESIQKMNAFMGALETTNHLIHNANIKNKGAEEEKDFWIKKLQDTHDVSYQKLKDEEQAGQELMAFINERMDRLKKHINNSAEVSKLLEESKASKFAGMPAMKIFIDKVSGIYKSFGNESGDGAIPKYRKAMEEKLQSSKQQLKNSFGILADLLFSSAFENMQYFFLSSADNLEKISTAAKQTGVHPLVVDCANELLQYIKTPGGVIDNEQYGILGYTDDAYLIQCLLSNLQQGGFIDTGSWNIDWDKTLAGSDVAFSLVGAGIKEQLDNKINSYCAQLVQQYDTKGSNKEEEKLQQLQNDVWQAKLMSLETSMIQNPVW